VILAVGRRPVDSVSSVQEAVESATIGEEVILDVERQGQRMEIKVRPRAVPAPTGAQRLPRPGMTPEAGLDPDQVGPALPGAPPLGPALPGAPALTPPIPPGTPSLPPEP
jgi:hypothetical protein